MRIDDWRGRLLTAVKNCGRSQRDISLAAGLGAGYLHSILSEGKEPTVASLLKICRAADVSVCRVLMGFEMTPEDEEFLRLASLADEELKRSLLLLLERGVKRVENQELPDESGNPPPPKRP